MKSKENKKTLQQLADEQGVSRQAIWMRTPEGKAWLKVYRKVYCKTEKFKAYRKTYYKRVHVPVSKLREAGLIK